MEEQHLLQLPPLIICIPSQALVPSLSFLLHSSFLLFLYLLETLFALFDMDPICLDGSKNNKNKFDLKVKNNHISIL
jgi:hypothetical protein